LHLTKVAAGVDGDQDRLERSTENYSVSSRRRGCARHGKGEAPPHRRRVLPSAIVNDAGKSDLVFDLHSLPVGRCELAIAGAVKDMFYFAPSSEPQEFGLVELVLSSTLAANYRMVEPDRSLTSARPGYSIRFAIARRDGVTRWRFRPTVQSLPTWRG
jgi:hypothetical protein